KVILSLPVSFSPARWMASPSPWSSCRRCARSSASSESGKLRSLSQANVAGQLGGVMSSLRTSVFLLALSLLTGCLPLPIAIQPYSSPITDGLALGEAEIRDASGIDPAVAQAVVDQVLEDGFIPL